MPMGSMSQEFSEGTMGMTSSSLSGALAGMTGKQWNHLKAPSFILSGAWAEMTRRLAIYDSASELIFTFYWLKVCSRDETKTELLNERKCPGILWPCFKTATAPNQNLLHRVCMHALDKNAKEKFRLMVNFGIIKPKIVWCMVVKVVYICF